MLLLLIDNNNSNNCFITNWDKKYFLIFTNATSTNSLFILIIYSHSNLPFGVKFLFHISKFMRPTQILFIFPSLFWK